MKRLLNDARAALGIGGAAPVSSHQLAMICDLRDELAATYAVNHARADLIDKLINDCAQLDEYRDALKAIARIQSLHKAQTIALNALGGQQ